MRDRLGIYIHIPFCVSKCSYCDFYSIAGGKQRMPDYQSALLSHISESAEAIESYEIDSIYIGGGTPSCYGAKRIVEILDELKRIGNVRLDSEITVEVNPDTTKLEELKLLRAEGVKVGILLLEQIKPYEQTAAQILAQLPHNACPVLFLEEEIRTGGMGMLLSDAMRDAPEMHGRTTRILALEKPLEYPSEIGQTCLKMAGCLRHCACGPLHGA